MKVNDIKSLVMDKVCLYSADDLKTLWTGWIKDVPQKYLDGEIAVIGANKKEIVDIGIRL